jgi:hypothetical protein
MSGHRHNPNAGTQNQGNSLGDRACVRQSKLYRQYESGNDVKSILGSSHLAWNADETQGAYKGKKVYDHMAADPLGVQHVTEEFRAPKHRQLSYEEYAPESNYSSKDTTVYGSRSRPVEDPGNNFLNGYSGNGRNNIIVGGPSKRDNEENRRSNTYDRQIENDGGGSYPLNKMKGGDSDFAYRTNAANGNSSNGFRQQMDDSASSYRSMRGEYESTGKTVSAYAPPVNSRGSNPRDDRSTRPW